MRALIAASPDALVCETIDRATQPQAVASHIDRLREAGPAVLVVDGLVLQPGEPRATREEDAAKQASIDAAAEQRWLDLLLPRADCVVCELHEARRFFVAREASRVGTGAQRHAGDDLNLAPRLARRLRAAGAAAACITGMRGPDGPALAWLDTEEAQGWLAPRGRAVLNGAIECDRFVRRFAAALARGFVVADAAVLACLPEASAGPSDLPFFSWGEALARVPAEVGAPRRSLGLYAIVDSAERLLQVLEAGVRTVQLRMKTPASPAAEWPARLRGEVQRSIEASRAAAAELFINDHWMLALELGASGVHLGQEDLLSLGEGGRSLLQASGLALGVSSHSLWELCRAAGLAPRYIACGPVWPTSTKSMPWRPQGLDNLAWWCRMAPAPVVAIGGVLDAGKVREAAACGADGVCIVRGLGEDPAAVLPGLQQAFRDGRSAAAAKQQAWPALPPHPSLPRRVVTASRRSPRLDEPPAPRKFRPSACRSSGRRASADRAVPS